MPISSKYAKSDKRKKIQKPVPPIPTHKQTRADDFLTIECAFPDRKAALQRRAHSSLHESRNEHPNASSMCIIETRSNGVVYALSNSDRVCLDRRGLTMIPFVEKSNSVRLVSLQHNLISNLDGFFNQPFSLLVFLDIYNNQLERLSCLDGLNNLRVLLVGKNRLSKIEGLDKLQKMEVLDLHGNKISHIGSGLLHLAELKVLNLAGNQIRFIGTADLEGLIALQELNLRKNRLRKLLGFGTTHNLVKLYLSNNDIHSVEDMNSIAKSSNLREISIDSNPVHLNGDCVSFLVSYLPQLTKLNGLQVVEPVRKAALAWRKHQEATNSMFMNLTSDVCLNIRREQVISNARTNWELLRSYTCTRVVDGKRSNKSNIINKKVVPAVTTKPIAPALKGVNDLCNDGEYLLTSTMTSHAHNPTFPKSAHVQHSLGVNRLRNELRRGGTLKRTSSLDTETSSTNTSTTSTEFVKLPPILVPILDRIGNSLRCIDGDAAASQSSSIGPNADSSSFSSMDEDDTSCESENDKKEPKENETQHMSSTNDMSQLRIDDTEHHIKQYNISPSVVNTTSITQRSSSAKSTAGTASLRGKQQSSLRGRQNGYNRDIRVVRSNAGVKKTGSSTITSNSKPVSNVATEIDAPGATNKQESNKEREHGGDYLIEISGRYLNVFGQCAVRLIDKCNWNESKAKDVTTVNFTYVNFNGITVHMWHRLKLRFPNAEHFVFKETNIFCMGQLNMLAELQGISSLTIMPDGNLIVTKQWQAYAIYRLSHWGLRCINGVNIDEHDIQQSNLEFESLTQLVIWSIPDEHILMILHKLRLDHNLCTQGNLKTWLINTEPQLRAVVVKEALQWRKSPSDEWAPGSERQRAKDHMGLLLDNMWEAVDKVHRLKDEWSSCLHEIVRNALVDYSHMDVYIKHLMQELNKI